MNAVEVAQGLGADEREAVLQALARRRFRWFLRYVSIRSDDPMEPKPVRWQPWAALLERADAWENRRSEVILKARQLGFSWLVAAYMLWRAMFFGWAVAYYSRGQDEATEELDQRVLFIWEHLPPSLQVAYEKSGDVVRFVLGNGSIRVFPSTEHSGVSFTFQLIVADESAFHRYGAANYAAYRPTLSAGGQYLCLSTASPELGPSGFFYRMWQASVEGRSPYAPIFVPWHARPGRDDAWLAGERAAYTGAPGSFDAYYPATAGAAFVSRSGLVFGRDSDDVLIFSPESHPRGNLSVDPCKWRECSRHYGYVDWGGGDPTALGLIGVTSSGRIHQFAEFHRTGPVTVEEIVQWFQRYAPLPNASTMGYDSIECGADEPVAIASLRSLGLPAKAADTRREEGLGTMAAFLKQRRFTLNRERCPNAVAEFDSYRWKENTDPFTREKFATATPHDHHGDHKDGERYVCMAIQAEELSHRDEIYVGAVRV